MKLTQLAAAHALTAPCTQSLCGTCVLLQQVLLPTADSHAHADADEAAADDASEGSVDVSVVVSLRGLSHQRTPVAPLPPPAQRPPAAVSTATLFARLAVACGVFC